MPRTTWSIEFWGKQLSPEGKPSRARNPKELVGADWLTAINYVKTLLPSVLYFPNFLFELLDKIYLEGAPPDADKHKYYRTILQDVLDSAGKGLDLERHILARAKSGDPYDKEHLDAVLLEMSSNITARVLQSWNKIFKRPVGNKEIVVRVGSDEIGHFVQFRLKDDKQAYAISERSLGFRWFFAFFLLTQYRGFRKDAPKHVLFLFDEPASNLHSTAQEQLLKSFESFPPEASIVYTTHSHYMINPQWLEGTFVVKNAGLEYLSADEDYNASKTLITLDKYRSFAANHPDQSTYYQPILDMLHHKPGQLENIPDVVMVEGKNDFYMLRYFQDKILTRSKPLNLMPGGGAGYLDDVLRLYIAWGRNFIALLDSDAEGKKQKKRYHDLFGVIVQGRIFCLEDINPSWAGKSMEYLITSTDRITIQTQIYPTATKFNKTHFNRAIQEFYLTDQGAPVSIESKNNIEAVLHFCEQKLGN